MSIVRLPLAVELTNREEASRGIYRTDTMLINCYIEHEDGRAYVAKRPGLTPAFTYNGGAATNGQGTVYYNGALYAIGSNVVYRLSGAMNGSADGTAWTVSTSATWKGRGNFAAAWFNGQFIVMGGIDVGGADLNDVWASTDGVNWKQLTASAPWGPRRNHCCVVLGNTLYLMGGIHATTYGDVWSTTDGVSWTQIVGTASWTARSAFGAVPFNNGIMLMGGRDPSGNLLNDVWFSADGATWTQLSAAAAWSARQLFGFLVFNGKIWVAGGITGGGVVATVYSSIDGIVWTNTGSLPTNRRSMMTTVYAGKMWFIGGTDNAATTWAGVYSSSDGVSFATPTSNYGGGVIAGGVATVVNIATGTGTFTAPTIFLIGGFIGGTVSSQVYKATLNVALASSFSPSTGASTTEQWQTETQNLGQYLIFKNTVDAWVFYAGTLQKITSTNYPVSTVAGVVNLDDTLYVMDATGVIYGSNLSDPFTWSANNYITADFEADTGICIAKYQQYVVALKSTSIQFYYDAGRYPGSPLLPVLSGNQKVGCVTAGSVVNMDNTLVFMATTGAADRYIAVLNGTTPQKISTPAIDRILFSWTPGTDCYAQNIKTNGHDFYVVTLTSLGQTLAYDFVERHWHVWQSANTAGNYFAGVNFVTDGTFGYVQDLNVGRVSRLDELQYQDTVGGLQNINVSITLSKYDNNNNHRKFCTKATIIGDMAGGATPPNTATLQWSDDDGTTFNTGQTVDLTTINPTVNRLGSFYRRVFRITHASNNPMRLEALELDLIEG